VANKQFDMGDYKEVAERIQDFRAAFPDGSIQAEIVPSPFDGFVAVKAFAYRTPDDPRPGTGLAWEPVPGKTPYTRDSELQNAETSAIGRAIIMVGASDAKRVASANEVRNRQAPDHGLLQAEIEGLLSRADGLVDPVKVREFAAKGVTEAQASIVKLNALLAKAG
jgi:hypothetical protein